MAFNSCDPCASNCGPGAAFLDPQSARVSVGIILCQIRELLSGGGPAGPVTVVNGPGAAAVNIQDGGNVISIDDAGGSLTVDGTVIANAGTGFPPVVTDGAAAGTQGIHILGTDGVNAQILSTDAAGVLNVNATIPTPAPGILSTAFSDYGFASITGAYTTALVNASPVSILDLLNDTDADLLISLDGVTDAFFLKAGTGKVYDLNANDLVFSTSISVKHNGVAPTLGSLVTTLLR